MREIKTWVSVFLLALSILLFSGFTLPARTAAASSNLEGLPRYIAQLKSGSAQQKAEAAYKLGQQHSSAAPAVEPLLTLLGDTTEVNAAAYRRTTREHRPTLGEEV